MKKYYVLSLDETGADFATRNAVPTQEMALLVPKSRAIPGNAVDTEAISNEERKMVHMRENTTTKSFVGGIRDDWSSIETTSRRAVFEADIWTTSPETAGTPSSLVGAIVVDIFPATRATLSKLSLGVWA